MAGSHEPSCPRFNQPSLAAGSTPPKDAPSHPAPFDADSEARDLLDQLTLQGTWQPIIAAKLRRAYGFGQCHPEPASHLALTDRNEKDETTS